MSTIAIMAALAVLSVQEILGLIGAAVVGAKLRQWAGENTHRLAEESKDDYREPTPFTHPLLFENYSSREAVLTKVHRKKGTTELWSEDWKHRNHFEVFASERDMRNGIRNRAVDLPGRRR